MATLKHNTAIAIGWDLSGTVLTQGSTFIVSIFLARLLDPADFGLVGMAMVFIGISSVFIDIGFSSALVQSKSTSHLTYNSVFYLNIFAGFFLTAIFYVLAPFIGLFYDSEKVVDLVRWLSLIFSLNSFNRVQNAILIKTLSFKKLTIRLLISSIIGGVVGILFAFAGYGVYSLVAQSISNAIVSTILLWTITDWRPGLNFSWKEIRSLLGFSSFAFFDKFLNSLFLRLDVLIIGKFFTPSILGYYSRASSLREQVTKYSSASITKVFFPVLSTLQDDDKEYSRVYFKVLSVIAFISFGLTGLLYILGSDIVFLLFGEKWAPSIIIFQVLILASCNQPLNSMMWNAFMSKGKSKENFYLGLFNKTIGLIPFYIAYMYGLFEFTIAIVVMKYCVTLVYIIFIYKLLDLSFKKHFKKIFEGMIPLIIIIFIFNYLQLEKTGYRILLAFFYGVTYLLYNWLIKNEGMLFIYKNLYAVKNKFIKNNT